MRERGECHMKKRVLEMMKKASEKELRSAMQSRCIMFCYEPKMPKKILELKKQKTNS